MNALTLNLKKYILRVAYIIKRECKQVYWASMHVLIQVNRLKNGRDDRSQSTCSILSDQIYNCSVLKIRHWTNQRIIIHQRYARYINLQAALVSISLRSNISQIGHKMINYLLTDEEVPLSVDIRINWQSKRRTPALHRNWPRLRKLPFFKGYATDLGKSRYIRTLETARR